MADVKGRFTLVLHSHLPYVLSHGRWPHGTDWLSEAAAECYIPLLNVFEKLIEENITPGVTVGLTPILCEQLAAKEFVEEFMDYCRTKVEAAKADEQEFSLTGQDHLAGLAKMWTSYYEDTLSDFVNKYDKNILAAFRKMQDQGALEIITSAATHGYLPLLGKDEAVAGQIRTGVETYKKHFGKHPVGIWIPECAYRPAYKWDAPVDGIIDSYDRLGVEEILYDNGIAYFMVDHHLLEGGKAVGTYAARFDALNKLWASFNEQFTQIEGAPRTPGKSYFVSSKDDKGKAVAILVRDPKTGLQVWSGEYGYPGDGNYLEFHKKHFPGGHRYWRVTSSDADLGDKQEYYPKVIEERIRENADHFKDLVKSRLLETKEELGQPGLLCAPFDTELFGHWWFEGPRFLYHVIKNIHHDPDIEMATGAQQIGDNPPNEVLRIPEGSWGEGGYHYIWLNKWTEWTWKHVYESETTFLDRLKEVDYEKDEFAKRILVQMARELLLLEASDWQFLISTFAARDYAESRLSIHTDVFKKLDGILGKYLENGSCAQEDHAFLEKAEERDLAFKELDLSWWSI